MVKPAAMPRTSSTTITRGTNSPPVVGVFALHDAPVPHEKLPPPFSRRRHADVTLQTPAGNARKYLSTQLVSCCLVARCPCATSLCQPMSCAPLMIAAGFEATANEAE